MTARRAHLEEGNRECRKKAPELIILMRDDCKALNRVLSAVNDIDSNDERW